MNRLAGVYRGIIVNILDPLQQRRVMVRLPTLPTADSGMWAPTCVAPGGNAATAGYRLGEDVLVAFEAGDPDRPVVMGKLG